MVARECSLPTSGYGALELKQHYKKYMTESLVLSLLLQLFFLSPFYVFRSPEKPIELRQDPKIPRSDVLIRAFIGSGISLPRVSRQSTGRIDKYKLAIPVPVAGPMLDSNVAFSDGDQVLNGSDIGGFGTQLGEPGGSGIAGGEDDIAPPPFLAVEKMPQVVRRVTPEYPATAIRAGIEGTVVLNLWVDKAGKVREAVVLKSSARILETAAQKAAMKWIFTPAIMQHGPVSVWVSIPFRFALHNQ